MLHHQTLIATIVAGLGLAFVFGALAHRLKVSPLVGYLLAGIIVGPFTPGYVANQAIAREAAELGVILLMFGVGLHFSLKDLLSVRVIAVPGALGQMAVATALGVGLGHALGWSLTAGLVFGLALSVASTVVMLRALQERRIVQTDRGRIAVGWLTVEDLAMVLALVLLPALAHALTDTGRDTDLTAAWLLPLAMTFGKVAAFMAFMLIVGRRVIPWVLHYVARTGSRELFRLAVFAIALGVAFGAASLFGVSFALGAFFAGMMMAERELSQRAAEETLPLRDAFAVLFFVSVGMLFNPMVILRDPVPLLATVGIIVLGKSLAAFLIVKAFRHDNGTAVTIAASLAQIGEFSFILAGLGAELGLLPAQGRDLILAGAILSIAINPLLFSLIAGRARALAKAVKDRSPTPANEYLPTALSEHIILVGFGQVGSAIAERLETAGRPFLVLDLDDAARRRAREAGFEVLAGNAADPRVLAAAGIGTARRVLLAIPNGFEAGGVVQEARRCNPQVEIVARAHSDAQVEHLMKLGADRTVLGENELADAMVSSSGGEDAPSDAVSEPAVGGYVASRQGRPMLTDAEWAVLASVRASQIGPGQTLSRAALIEIASRVPDSSPKGLDEALRRLVEKGYMLHDGDAQMRVTKTGYLAAAGAPEI